MTLDRWIALVILVVALAYGYGAFFTMDQLLPPFMRNTPVWPSTFPKILSVMAVVISLAILLGLEKSGKGSDASGIDYKKLKEYNYGQAIALLGLMIAYALMLRPAGFIASTTGFLVLGAVVLGERKFHWLILIAVAASFGVWYLVQEVLGIFLRPWPFFLGT
ncbi:MAG: tripartite tricarboxylate transporter TctB family protein [Pseudomonadota bacterium]